MEIQVFYVRMSCPWLEKAPQSLTIRCGNTTTSSSSHNNCNGGLNSSLEINRAKIFPSQMGVSLTLRRDRMDADSAEAIYVCTDMVRTSDSFPFFICDDQEETLVCANIKRSCSYGPPSISKMSNNWSLECSYVSSSKAQLCNGNGLLNVGADCDNISCMEICVAGRDSNHNSPVILSRTLQLVGGAPTSTRRVARHCRRNSYSTLDVILEHDENENDAADNGDGYAVFGYESSKEAFMVDSNLSRQVEEHMFYQELDLTSTPPLGFYQQGAYFDADDDGELSWFNTGVRVGVGIGLGMCVGIGVGVGLLMRGYQATTKNLKRRLL